MTDIERINAVQTLLEGVKESLEEQRRDNPEGHHWYSFAPGDTHTSVKRRLTVAREELLKVSKHYG